MSGIRGYGMAETGRIDISEVQVAYRDIDMHGYLHSHAYLAYAEAALRQFWRHRPKIEEEPLFVVRKVECGYHRGLQLDDLARLTVRIDKIGGRSVGFNVLIEVGKELAADVEMTWMAADPESREPAPLPEEIRDWLYQFLP